MTFCSVLVFLDNQVPSDRLRLLAAQLNEAKAMFLHDLRTQFLQEAPFSQEEDIDAEQVAKRAAESVFNDQRKDIASRFINNGKRLEV